MSDIVENKLPSADLPFVDESIDSVSKSTAHYFKRHLGETIGAILITIAIEAGLIYLRVAAVQAYAVPLIILFCGYSFVKSKIEKEFMQQFAKANGYSFSNTGQWDTGMLFHIGYDQQANNVVSGVYKNYPIKLYEFEYTIGYGKGKQTFRNTVFSLQFDADMPDIFLESKDHPLSGLFSKGNTVSLEGDFDKYFQLHVPAGYEVEALEVFTPDIMVDLIDKASLFNMEIADNHLLLYRAGIVEEKDKLYAMYTMAQYFIEKLGPVFAGMKTGLSAAASVKTEIDQMNG